jgi:hypothetical protein
LSRAQNLDLDKRAKRIEGQSVLKTWKNVEIEQQNLKPGKKVLTQNTVNFVEKNYRNIVFLETG